MNFSSDCVVDFNVHATSLIKPFYLENSKTWCRFIRVRDDLFLQFWDHVPKTARHGDGYNLVFNREEGRTANVYYASQVPVNYCRKNKISYFESLYKLVETDRTFERKGVRSYKLEYIGKTDPEHRTKWDFPVVGVSRNSSKP